MNTNMKNLRKAAHDELHIAAATGLTDSILVRDFLVTVRVVWAHGQAQPFAVVKHEDGTHSTVAAFEDLDDALDCMEAVIAGDWDEDELAEFGGWWDARGTETKREFETKCAALIEEMA